jgi:hypothetical protein
MKNLRQLCAITALTFALASSTFAGQIDCGEIPPPPPPPQETSSVMGTIDYFTAINGTQSAETASINPVTEFTLNILQSMLALF